MSVARILLLCSTSPAAIAAPCNTAAAGPEFGSSFILSEPEEVFRGFGDPLSRLVLLPEPELPEGVTGIWVDEWPDIEKAIFKLRATATFL